MDKGHQPQVDIARILLEAASAHAKSAKTRPLRGIQEPVVDDGKVDSQPLEDPIVDAAMDDSPRDGAK